MDDTVDTRLEERLTRACRTHVGDSLRSVVYFTREGYERTYLRENLTAEADLESFVENARTGLDHRYADPDSELGAYEYTVHGFENGAVLRVVAGDRGVFATTDPLSIARFEEVAIAIRDVLESAEN